MLVILIVIGVDRLIVSPQLISPPYVDPESLLPPTTTPIPTIVLKKDTGPLEIKHKLMAFLKGEQEVWIYDFHTAKQYMIFPGIDVKRFCGEGCDERHLSFSKDSKKLAVDLLVHNNEAVFGYIDFSKNTQKIEYVSKGYLPEWSPDGKHIVFYERTQLPTHIQSTLKSINLETRTVVGFPPDYTFQDWISDKEVLLTNFDDELNGLFRGNITNGDITEFSITDLSPPSGKAKIYKADVSPDKNKILILAYADRGVKVAVADKDGANLKVFNELGKMGEAAGYYAANWSPDGEKVALKIWPVYKDILFNISIFDTEGITLKTINNSDVDAGSSLCWVSFGNKEIIAVANSNGSIALHSLVDGKSQAIAATYGYNGVFTCN